MRLRGVAGQRLARWRDVQRPLGPAAHAGLRIARVIVGDHMVDDDDAGIGFAQRLDLGDRRCRLRLGRHQGGAIDEAPAVILRMRDLDAPGAERDGELHHFAGARDIGAMNDGVDGQRQARLRDPCGDRLFALEGARIAGDAVGGGGLRILDRELHMIEAGVGQRLHPLLRQADARGDQIGVKAD